jgi:hypothetical protein
VRRYVPWVLVGLLYAVLTVCTTHEALSRYRELRTGWSWDLAYYNQWLWTVSHGERVISVRPIASYADEGPSVWKMNYLSPVRFLLLPIYALRPDPTTLLIVHGVVFWLCLPASYTLVKSESGSSWIGLLAVALVPFTPLLWPLAINDFRELQLAIPFVIWAIQGVRERSVKLSALGIAGMLACRQEFALVVAMLGLVAPKEREDIGRTYRWLWVTLFLGIGWLFWAFMSYLALTAGRYACVNYLEQFRGVGPPLRQTGWTAGQFLVLGLGSWSLLALFAPRVAFLAVPWLWSLSHGKWALGFLATSEWHHVRYTAPLLALVLAAGLVGFARISIWLLSRRGGRVGLVCLCLVGLAGLWGPKIVLDGWWALAPQPISRSEATEVWKRVGEVGADDGVLAAYEVSAPLSSRRWLYSYVLPINEPKGYPNQIDRGVRWAFVERSRLDPESLEPQGFRKVYEGAFLAIYRRD